MAVYEVSLGPIAVNVVPGGDNMPGVVEYRSRGQIVPPYEEGDPQELLSRALGDRYPGVEAVVLEPEEEGAPDATHFRLTLREIERRGWNTQTAQAEVILGGICGRIGALASRSE